MESYLGMSFTRCLREALAPEALLDFTAVTHKRFRRDLARYITKNRVKLQK